MYGLYLTLSSWVLFHVATRTEFFHAHLGMFSLNTQAVHLDSYCARRLAGDGLLTTTPICAIPQYGVQTACSGGHIQSSLTALDQCTTEQLYVRDSITRALMYSQVSQLACCQGNALLRLNDRIWPTADLTSGAWSQEYAFKPTHASRAGAPLPDPDNSRSVDPKP